MTLCGLFMVVLLSAHSRPQSDTDSLIAVLKDLNQPGTARCRAVEWLGERKGSNVIGALSECFSDADPFLRGAAATSVARVGRSALPVLIRVLETGNDTERWCAAIALSKMRDCGAEAVPSLTKALSDSTSNVRWCAAIALGNLKGEAAGSLEVLRAILLHENEDEEVKWAAAFALGSIGNTWPQHRTVRDVSAVIDSLMPALLTEFHVPGGSVVLMNRGEIAWSKGYGLTTAGAAGPVTSETAFEACSMSKPVLAYLAMKLVDDGKLDLDVPLSTYLPETFISSGNYGGRVTARMVLSHTSGLPNWRKGEEEMQGPLPIYFLPGSKFSYSGEGYYYLQRVLEHITRIPLDVIAKKTLFDPLGLKHTSFVWTPGIDPFISTGHDSAGNALPRTRYAHPNAGYSLYTTGEDYAKFVCRVMSTERSGASALSPVITRQMLTKHVEVQVRAPIPRPGKAFGVAVYWGLGWAIDSTISGNIFYHSGANRSGFRCYSQFDIHEGSGIVIMTNSLNGSELWRRVIRSIGDF
jgi:CubicO group peptidase (beta-lactamase class C family)